MKFYIKEAREKAGYSQKELAQIIGVASNTFHGYESGKHDPKSELLVKIAKACNVTVDFLLGIEEEAHNEDDSSKKLIEIFQQLNEKERTIALRMLKAIAEEEEK